MYEINVSLNGQHFFATDERSITSIYELKKVFPIIKEKFPKSEGYEITVTYWEKIGQDIDNIEDYLKEKGGK